MKVNGKQHVLRLTNAAKDIINDATCIRAYVREDSTMSQQAARAGGSDRDFAMQSIKLLPRYRASRVA
jgi:hypothetical protein